MLLSGINDTLLLIALGIGYVVLYLAKREEKKLQFCGYIIGGVIIGLSIAYLLINLWVQARICAPRMRSYKGMMQQRMMPPTTPTMPKK